MCIFFAINIIVSQLNTVIFAINNSSIYAIKHHEYDSKNYDVGHDITYKRSYKIWGDKYTEYIVLNFNCMWPSKKYKAQDFKVSLNIKRKYTIKESYDGSIQKWEDSSLEVAGAYVNFAADKGEFFDELFTTYEGKSYKGYKGKLGLLLDLPDMPFRISSAYDQLNLNNNNSEPKKIVKHGVIWEPWNVHLIEVDDFFRADINVATNNATDVNKGLKFKWNYIITSSGINGGVAVPAYNLYDSFTNTLYYYVSE